VPPVPKPMPKPHADYKPPAQATAAAAATPFPWVFGSPSGQASAIDQAGMVDSPYHDLCKLCPCCNALDNASFALSEECIQ
jgi:hypothetical protein